MKDLAGAFAQLPRLPKMLKASAIVDTLVDGCEKGAFVFRLPRSENDTPTSEVQKAINDVLANVKEDLKLRQSGS